MNQKLVQQKNQIREEMKKRRTQLSADAVQYLSLQVIEKLMSSPHLITAQRVAFYAPILNEVDVLPLGNSFLQQGKLVYFPRVVEGHLEFCQVQNLDQIKKGKFGVMEPEIHIPVTLIQDIEVFMIPGLAFDQQKNRIGYGKGFYDQVLSQLDPKQLAIGICYDFQLLETIPDEVHDQKVHSIYTNQKIISGS
jgi:5-formyltetrahydrofolate cyclo-ligase